MDSTNQIELEQKLTELARRIDARVREFREQGEFSNIHQETMGEMRRRYEQLQEKVDAAARQGSTWELIRNQLARDYRLLFDDFLRFEGHLDAETMKEKKPEGW